MTLRPATHGDAAFLRELFASTRAAELAALPLDAAGKQAFLAAQHAAQSTHFARAFPDAQDTIVLVDERPAGRLMLDRSGSEVRVVDVALLPEHRGRGLGTRLLEHVIAEAHGAGVPVTLAVRADNPARALYERVGFVAVDADAFDVEMRCQPNTA